MDNEDAQSSPIKSDAIGKRLKSLTLRPGESLGSYRVVNCISQGLMANYYHVQHVRDLHDATVGVFHARTTTDPGFLERLKNLQGALVSGSDEGRGIPAIRDCLVLNGRHCIFLDPVLGCTLSEYFAEHAVPGEQGLSTEQTTQILAQLLGILGYAHSLGIDHRDLESDLIFVQEDGSLQVLGLGVKAAIGVDLFEGIVSASVSPLVSSAQVGRVNSFDVMSPECRSGEIEDAQVDVYAVGVIGYWLLTAQKPDMVDLQPPSVLVPGLSAGWDAFCVKSLMKDRERRYDSCKLALLGLKETGIVEQSVEVSFIQRQLDRIPIPKQVVERGSQATHAFRLMVIGVIGLTLVALAASFMDSAFTEDSVEAATKSSVAMKVTGREPDLRVRVSPATARVSFLESDESFVAVEGVLDLGVRVGEHKIKVSAPQYREQLLTVSILAGEVVEELNVELESAWVDVEVQSEPGATVFVVDAQAQEIEVGVTDTEGGLLLDAGLFASAYKLNVRKEGYEPYLQGAEDVALGTVGLVEAPLVELPSSVTIQTKPEGAWVFVDDVEVGVSPFVLEVTDSSKDYQVEVKLDGYRVMNKTVEVDPGCDQVVRFADFVHGIASLVFNATFIGADASQVASLEQELTLELDEAGERLSLNSEELTAIWEGGHSVRFFHPLYSADPIEIHLRDHDALELDLLLSPLPGQIEVLVPEGLSSTVWADDVEITLVDGQLSVPAHQVLELKLIIRDHLTMWRDFKLTPNQSVQWDVSPTPIPGPVAGKGWKVPYLSLQLAWVDAGRFTMGSPLPEAGRLPNEGPLTQVQLTQGYWIGAHEVTQAQFFTVTGEKPSEFFGAQLPVESVSWASANRFCEMLTKNEAEVGRLPEGYAYRLPTEAEWEYAARAGASSPFSFGARADFKLGNFRGVYPPDPSQRKRGGEHYGTLPVGSFEPNALGLFDVHGNVAEWTLDHYSARLPGGSLIDPAPRSRGAKIAARGGSWEDSARHVRSAYRVGARIDLESNAFGLRVVLAPVR